MKILQLLMGCLFLTVSTFAQFQVGTQNLVPEDPARSNRAIDLDVYYPSTTGGTNAAIAAGEFPVLVFGHGFSMATTEYTIWYETLAAQGYIIALPNTEGGLSPVHEEFALDLSFLIDYFLSENANTASFFYQSMNGKSGMLGHSMGGGCSWTGAAGNSNVTTMVTLAAAETNGVSAIANAANLNIPTLSIAGTEDCVLMAGGMPIDMYNNLPTSNYHVYLDIIGASHCQFGVASFGSLCTLGELFCSGFMPIADQHEQMLLSANNWLDYYLKDDCAAWSVFENHLTTGSGALHNYIEKGAAPSPSAMTPTLTQNGNTLTSSAATTYQWYLNGNAISGATTESYTATTSGSYTVMITDNNGCTATSDALAVTITGVESLANDAGFMVFPNPADQQLNIEATFDKAAISDIQLIDIYGKVVLEQRLEKEHFVKHQLSIEHLDTGVYFVKLLHQDIVLVSSFVKI